MKKRIRKTGEIVDVIMFTAPYVTDRDDTKDFVDYIDSKGRERRRVPMNYYWDLEDVEEELTNKIDWEQRRYEIAKDVFAEIYDIFQNEHSEKVAVRAADALIAELKKGGNNGSH